MSLSILAGRRAFALVALAAATAALVVGLLLTKGSGPAPAGAASHREAPLISEDPYADVTDFYLFRSPDKPDTLTAIMAVNPFEEPAAGPNWYGFSPSAKYSIHFDNSGDGRPDVTYEVKFSTGKASLSDTLPLGCIAGKCQSYNIWRVVGGKGSSIGKNFPVAPNNIGPETRKNFENGATYQQIRDRTIMNLQGGGAIYAGPSDDPFFGDIGAAFDAVTIRNGTGNKGGGVDSFAGFNVHLIAIQIPISAVKGKGDVVGAWGAVYRPKSSVRGTAGASDPWVQVSRLGNPLLNELLIPTNMKDKWNASSPAQDAQFNKFLLTPTLAAVTNSLYKARGLTLNIPETNRTDLKAAFHHGLALLKNGTGPKSADEVRLNIATPLAASPNRLGPLAGDVQGWPNGRRLQDDVIDIALIALGGALYTPANTLPLGDGVNANDRSFGSSFPYVPLPHEGFTNSHGAPQPTTP
jgi:hypothetical protein